MSKIYHIKGVDSNQYEQILEKELKDKFKRGMVVAVKLHMGEDKGMFNLELAKRAINVLNKLGCKPFLFDTPVKYLSPRHTKEGYEKLAVKHGFTKEKIGCPVIISNDYVVVKTEHMSVEVSKDLAESDAFLVLSHLKGHPASGMGAAIKNLAMGCVSIKSKNDLHSLGLPEVSDACTACGTCAEVCFFNAIDIKDRARINAEMCGGCSNCFYNCPNNAITAEVSFDTLMAEAASAVLKTLDNKPVFYVNDVRSITKNCDCFSNPGEIIAKDVGVLLGDDIVAIEKASVDLINEQEKKNVFKEVHHHDPYLQIKEARKIGLGKEDYDLTRGVGK
nr:DUF362 domain-containing protein [Nanoarchaeota archaeon]